jgi:hypothetical protein
MGFACMSHHRGTALRAALLIGLLPALADAATYTVTSAADSGAGTLRAAIEAANATLEADTINFAIGTGTVEIVLQAPLPLITQRLKIEGFTQPPAGGTVPRIRLVGGQMVESGQGLRLSAANCTPGFCVVRGLQIVEFPLEGILVEAGQWAIRGNYIGTDGTLARGNARNGISVEGEQSLIGGTAPGDGNLISANGYAGIGLYGTATTVEGNRIGTDASGLIALGNAAQGIRVFGDDHLIGGFTAASRNLISGNGLEGIAVEAEAEDVLILFNRVGTRADGNAALGNTRAGIAVSGPRTVVGLGGSGNLVSANGYHGVELGGAATGSLVQGNRIGTNADGLAALPNQSGGVRVIDATDVEIGGSAVGDGNLISGNLNSQVTIDGGASDVRVLGNRIGTDASGTLALGTGAGGLGLAGTNLQIGAAGAGNLISGNANGGIGIFGSAPDDIRIQANRIGTRADGLAALGNGGYGIRAILGSNVLIGGSAPGEGNLVSGNERGIAVEDGMVDTVVQGNVIGLDATQSTKLGNGDWSGLDVSGPGTLVGGSTPGAGNVIAGHQDSGLVLYGTSAPGPIVQGNFLGTNSSGAAGLGNLYAGVQMYLADNALIGGTGPGEGNEIAYNGFNGIYVRWGTRNRFIGNRIHDNELLGIEVSPQGPSANDVLDADGGPNFGQNHPVIRSALSQGGNVAIQGELISEPSSQYLIEFNHSAQCDPSGIGQGAQPIGFTTVVTDASGRAGFDLSLPLAATDGVLTAIATSPDDASSEFSPCHGVAGPNAGEFQLWRGAFIAYEGLPYVEIGIVRSNGNQGSASVQFETLDDSATAPADYASVAQRIDFADGETYRTVKVPIVADGVTEGQQQFQVRLSAPLGGAVLGARSQVPAIIIDVGSDFPFYGIDDQIADAPESGTGTMSFTVYLSASDVPQTINFATLDATAVAGQDFVATSGALQFPASSETQTRTIEVEILPNQGGEKDESFLVDVWASGDIAVFAGYGTGVIRATAEEADRIFGDGFED